MGFNPIRDALGVPGDVSKTVLRDAIDGSLVFTTPDGYSVTDFTPGLCQAIVNGGIVFMRDPSDTVTPHDGVTCLVVQGGVRFKAEGAGSGAVVRRYAVATITDTPPGSPSVGDCVLVDTGGTGAFAAKDGQIATWFASGWRFVVPKTYDEAHVEDESAIYHFNASSAWVLGSPALTIGTSQIRFVHLKHGLGLSVENQTTNTPPVSPSDGVAYIIGPSPTGAWSGHAGKVAYYVNSAWEITAASIGWSVYDKAVKAQVVYSAAGWVTLVSGYSQVVNSAVGNTGGLAAGGTYNYSAATAPTTGGTVLTDTQSFTPKKSGAEIEVDFSADDFLCSVFSSVSAGGEVVVTAALFIDSGATAVDWALVGYGRADVTVSSSFTRKGGVFAPFRWTAPDTSAHDIKIRVSIYTFGMAGATTTITKTKMTIRERA
jgi:hypothetical protein